MFVSLVNPTRKVATVFTLIFFLSTKSHYALHVGANPNVEAGPGKLGTVAGN